MNIKRSWAIFCWYLRYGVNRLERQHIFVIGLFLLWTMMLTFVDWPLHVENGRLDSQRLIFTQLHAKHRKPVSQDAPPQDLTKEFTASLPISGKYSEQLRALIDMADKYGVTVSRIDYKYELLPALPIQRLALRMQASASELQQRRFMRAALNAFANLAIARLAYAKGKEAAVNAEYRLEINLYYRIERSPA